MTILCVKLIKYLNYLAWCILGVKGTVISDGTPTEDSDMLRVTGQIIVLFLNAILLKCATYQIPAFTVLPSPDPVGPYAIDIEVGLPRRNRSTQRMLQGQAFPQRLMLCLIRLLRITYHSIHQTGWGLWYPVVHDLGLNFLPYC